MIAQLRGTLLEVDADRVVLDVGGVGFELLVPGRIAARAGGDIGGSATFITHLHVRDDALLLFGFQSRRELAFFRQLIAVSGVGPKVALAVLSGYPVEELELAALRGDHKRFESIPGIGRKLAQRLVVELKDRIVPSEPLLAADQPGAGDAAADLLAARSALVNLGVGLGEAEEALRGAPTDASVEELIRYALAKART